MTNYCAVVHGHPNPCTASWGGYSQLHASTEVVAVAILTVPVPAPFTETWRKTQLLCNAGAIAGLLHKGQMESSTPTVATAYR